LQEEVQRQTRELQDAYQKLQDIDKNKDNFLAIASHELRTPMTIIKGYSDLFLQNTFGPMNPDARAYMQKIYNNTEALIELVNNILDISKIEAGRFEIVKKPVIINETISRICENFENLYREK
jgi:two-component system cell cycle sensor histidine kinase PleC